MVPLAPRCGKQTARLLLMASLSLAQSLKRSLLRSNALILTRYLKKQRFEEGTNKLIAGAGEQAGVIGSVWARNAHSELSSVFVFGQ